jgi:hypothetical protein
MSLFRYAAYLAPLAVGFGVAAALAATWDRPVKRRLDVALSVTGGVLVLLALAAVTESAAALGKVAALVAALALLVAGIFALAAAFRLPPAVCQIVASLAVVGLMSTVFLMGPVIDHAERVGMPGDEIYRRITLALDLNPVMVMGYSAFGTDWLHGRLYGLGLADFQHGTPAWDATSVGYAVAGFACFAASLGLTALRLRLMIK